MAREVYQQTPTETWSDKGERRSMPIWNDHNSRRNYGTGQKENRLPNKLSLHCSATLEEMPEQTREVCASTHQAGKWAHKSSTDISTRAMPSNMSWTGTPVASRQAGSIHAGHCGIKREQNKQRIDGSSKGNGKAVQNSGGRNGQSAGGGMG